MSRRTPDAWSACFDHTVSRLDVLIPTVDRPAELAVTLSGLAAQNGPDFAVIISDQSEDPVEDHPAVAAMVRLLRAQGRPVTTDHHLPRRGPAEQRQHLFELSSSPAVLYLDDDVWLEPGALRTMHTALDELDCGFVGMAVQGLSFLDDHRPDEESSFSFWDGDVVAPERIRPADAAFERWRLHNAANLVHIAASQDLGPAGWRPYRVAWIGGCVLYRRSMLAEVGAFEFWSQLPDGSVGEDVTAEWLVMERYGGAGIIPSGAVHLESPTTLPRRENEAWRLILEG